MSRKKEDREALSRSNECLKWHNYIVISIYHSESGRSQPFWVTLGPIAEFPFEPKAMYVEFSSLKRRFYSAGLFGMGSYLGLHCNPGPI